MSTKELPDGRAQRAVESPPLAMLASLGRPVPVLALPGFTLFPGTLVPLSAFEPEPCRTLAESLADRRLLVLAALDEPGPDRALHRVAGLGRIVSDRRHPDGRVDAFVHGLARVALTNVVLGQDGLVADLELLADAALRSTVEPGLRLYAVASSLQRVLAVERPEEAEALASLLASSEHLGQVTNRLGAAFMEAFSERQALLEQQCPALRCDLVAARLGELLLASSRPTRGVLH